MNFVLNIQIQTQIHNLHKVQLKNPPQTMWFLLNILLQNFLLLFIRVTCINSTSITKFC